MPFAYQPVVLVAAAFLLLAISVGKRIIRERKSPLAAILSAAVGAAYTRLAWAFPHEFRGTVTIDLPRLHDKLGPLIRVGPNEVSFYSLDIYDAVHEVGSKFKKDPRVYGEFVQGGHPALFSITDPQEHPKRRRLMGQLYNRSKMSNLEPLMLHHVEHFIESIEQTGSDVDLIPACRALEADIISRFSFGTAIGAIESWRTGQNLAMVVKNDEKATWMPLLTSCPSMIEFWGKIEDIIASVTGSRTPYSRALKDFHHWCNVSWQAALDPMQLENAKRSPFPNLIQTLVRSGLPTRTALAEARENLGPGTDTTSATLAHILWALAHNQQFQEELFRDLASLSFTTDMTSLEGVAKLRACVKEGIRWAGAAAAMLPRVVPEGGVELHGKFIPDGTVFTSSPIWYLHDSVAFSGPKEYDPYRWLTSDGNDIREDPLRDQFYIPFSKGANVCIGAHFSYLELYISVSQLLRRFQIKVHESVQSESYMYHGSSGWSRVPLPSRKEWVAAVPQNKLWVVMMRRKA